MLNNENSGTVFLVHCVDTEGPLYESPLATIETFVATHGVDEGTAEKLMHSHSDPNLDPGLTERWRDHMSRRNYNADWHAVDNMLQELMSDEWREKYLDDAGCGYVFSWFVLDHVGFEINPRRRALGYHVVYDHYLEWLSRMPDTRDRLYWHFHPVSWSREAHKSACTLSSSLEHLQILCRRVIDRNDFPVAFRPGQHTERSDLNLFLEQWIPFDYGSQSGPERPEDAAQRDISGGRFGDWRRAPQEWGFYHPSIWDYQLPGNLHRYVVRCLNLDSRLRPITVEEMKSAFIQAENGRDTIMAITNHDQRDMRPGIEWLMTEINKMRAEFPRVTFLHANAVEAIRSVAAISAEPPLAFEASVDSERAVLDVRSGVNVWGNQPFLAIRQGHEYLHENFDRRGENHWSFTFDHITIPLERVDTIGVAAHSLSGDTTVITLNRAKNWESTVTHKNVGDWMS